MNARGVSTGLILVLAIANAASAIALVVSRHDYRQAATAITRLTRERDELDITYGRLQLEQATWAQTRRIDQSARTQLGMRVPGSDATVEVRP